MGRGDKIRDVDFSHKEFCKMAGVSERNFLNWLDRFFAMYNIEEEYRRRLKKKKQEAGDDYLWPIEWAELMALLIDTFGENPLFTKPAKRENKQGNLIAEDIVTYYKLLLTKSEEKLPQHLVDMIITLDGYKIISIHGNWLEVEQTLPPNVDPSKFPAIPKKHGYINSNDLKN